MRGRAILSYARRLRCRAPRYLDTLLVDLASGTSPSAMDRAGDSLVMLAAYHRHGDLVRPLLARARGAHPSVRYARGQAPLEVAAFLGNST